MRSRARIVLAALLLAACSGTPRRAGAELPIAGYGAYDATGIASWYGDELAGSRTASGDRFDPDDVTVAHRSLPLGSYVEITALDTGRSIIARVNDRGPGRRDRIVDLSHGAARQLGTDRRPTAAVRIRAIVPSALQMAALRAGRLGTGRDAVVRAASDDLGAAPEALPYSRNGRYTVQIATFSNEPRARALADLVGADLLSAGNLWRVRLGPYADGRSAQRARDAVAARGYGDAKILPAE